MLLSRWSERSPEEAALLNPALLAVILVRAVEGYRAEVGRGLPFELTFLVPPVVLVKATRERLPRQARTSLPAWLEDNPDVRLRFAETAVAMAPLVREAIVFGCSHGVLALDGAQVCAGKLDRSTTGLLRSTTDEVRDVVSRSSFVGRWYALAGATETVMALWGVRP
ncbi:MAG: hypothetical protein HYV63_22750 [Candidatus Schekmanbacteria bacterium]|nr:hypothetical protein [Candidatus Schekmanbacteria bacterium]